MNVYEKYGVVVKNKERFYVETLYERDYLLEGATPVYLLINDIYISDRTWIGLLPKIANYLQKKYSKSVDELLSFRTQWSKQAVFSDVEKINYSLAFDRVYLNTNHTAIHSVWLIQDLLDYFGVNKEMTTLLIKRPPSIEPKEVKDFVKQQVKEEFKSFLIDKKLEEKAINNVINGIEILNTYLQKITKTYNDFYLLDNSLVFANCKSRLLKNIHKYVSWNEKQLTAAKKMLDLYTMFSAKYFK